MNLSWMDSVKDAINNNSAVRAQQARMLEDIRETMRPELDKAGQLMAMKMQGPDISWMSRPAGRRRSR
ncbi:hypothetical protein BOX37_22490 [Nocardia mangyaensis]|uniref:Uncharacterized protein n=1 Tax=Nocardia mangyaensis TaxID=2213200 RepID=A0A1J0VW56_9NOCA|nr:hypothetical protein [Nocardia mangyaensis]APE36234.1 hypothetical protein BOX37_22490 [Nocardia mangyaensis]